MDCLELNVSADGMEIMERHCFEVVRKVMLYKGIFVRTRC